MSAENHSNDALDALLRRSAQPEAPQWFAARTLARLRNDLHARPLLGGWSPLRLWLGPWSPQRFPARIVLSAALVLVTLLGVTGLHLKAARDNRQLTYDALALAAQGEAPFNDEETTWPDGGF